MCAARKLIGVCLIGLAVASPIAVPSAAAPRETEDGITEWPHFNPVDITPTIKPKPTSQPRAARSLDCGFPPWRPCLGLEDEIRHRLDDANLLPSRVADDLEWPLVRPGSQTPHIIPPKVPRPPAGHYEDEKEDGSDPKAPRVKRDVAGAEAEAWVTGLHDFEDDDGPLPAVTRVTVMTTVPTTTTVSPKKSAASMPTDPVTVPAQVTVTTSIRVTVISTVPTTVSKWVPVIPVTTSTLVPVVTSTGVNSTTLTAIPTTISTTVRTTISKWIPTTFSTWFLTTSGTVSTLVGDASEWPGTYTKPHVKATPLEVPRPSYKDKNSDATGSIEDPTAKFPGTYTHSFRSTVTSTTHSTVTKPAHNVEESAYVSIPPSPPSAVTSGRTKAAPEDKVHDQHVDSDDDSVRLRPLEARDLEPKERPGWPLVVPTKASGQSKKIISYETMMAAVTDMARDLEPKERPGWPLVVPTKASGQSKKVISYETMIAAVTDLARP
ncbi:hypothetical protein DL764_005045 [Monosporascus ibericus]|uniref:Uncharacterized protein n=1 Tax=Monosporascus ibericus TaxID=155417 RepID=A0A4Q4TD74_9PEZI|nr:hypothetical protein DL764_005045 [Monosporascus ibericus]